VLIAFNTALGRSPYDAITDFTPISHVVSQPLVVVNPAVPVAAGSSRTRAQKSRPHTSGGTRYGHLWWDGPPRQGDWRAIAYNGIAPALKDVMGGQVPLLIDAIITDRCAGKRARCAAAIVRSQRAKSLPDLPTLAEQGFTGLDAAPFYGVLGPAGMDPAVVQKLSSSLQLALAMPAVREKLQDLGFDVVASSPEAYAKLIRDEIERWSKVVRDQGSRWTEGS
jgi:tripartite-type tricarboxylate transporter receptor subunit TctC